MSSTETKLEQAAAAVTTEIARAKSVWASHEIWIVAAVCLLIGAVVGHKL
jgi:hypothetical protein